MLLQLAFLAFLVLALADPIFRWQQARARRLVLVVDNSASMNATDVAPSRLEAAKAEGRRLIDGMRLGDEMAIIAAGTQPAGRLRPDRPSADPPRRARFDRPDRRPDPGRRGGRRWPAGCSRAPRRCAGSSSSPTAASRARPSLPAQEDVELDLGGQEDAATCGITRLQARRSLLDPIGYEILVEVANASDEPAAFRLELDLDDEPIDVVPLNLAAGRAHGPGLREDLGRGRPASRPIDRDDALLADNTAWAILPRPRPPEGDACVTPGNLFLEKVFEAMPLVDLEVVKVRTRQEAQPPARMPACGRPITVFHRRVPDALPPGNVLVIEPDGPARSGSWARSSRTRSSPSRTETRR